MSAVEEIKNQQACCYCVTVTTKKTNRTTASSGISITRNVCRRGFSYYFNIKASTLILKHPKIWKAARPSEVQPI